MDYGCVTSDLPPRLAWGVGRLTKPQRSRAGGGSRKSQMENFFPI